MSGGERIGIQLSNFEKLQILREELEKRQEELTALEVSIRDNLFALERRRYLESLSPYYAAYLADAKLPTADEIAALEERRQQLRQLIQTIESAIAALVPSSAVAVSAASGAARKSKFDSFEDFAKNQLR